MAKRSSFLICSYRVAPVNTPLRTPTLHLFTHIPFPPNTPLFLHPPFRSKSLSKQSEDLYCEIRCSGNLSTSRFASNTCRISRLVTYETPFRRGGKTKEREFLGCICMQGGVRLESILFLRRAIWCSEFVGPFKIKSRYFQ